MNIKILRLKNGDDIICDLEIDNDNYYVNSPMLIWLESNGKVPKLCMDYWLPVQVIENNHTSLKEEDILAEFYPNEQLTEYYMNTVEHDNSVLRAKEEANNMSDEEIINTIIALQEGNGVTFH